MKPIQGFDRYYCDKLGNVFSLVSGSSKKLKPSLKSNGYHSVCLYKDGKQSTRSIHRLVMESFHGKSELEVNHKNGDRLDNRLSNLEFVTKTDNENHARKILGKNFRGERNGQSKLKKSEVLQIKKLAQDGVRYNDISAEFGISIAQISRIKNNKRWASQ